MAFSGIVLASVMQELKSKIIEGRIEKIYQPEKFEINFLVHRNNIYRLLISAHPVYSRIHLTEGEKENPLSPPTFCMLLRKHLSGGRILKIEQEGLDRILRLTVRTRDEFDLIEEKILLVEIMGKHSNIILLDEDEVILGSIKTVTEAVSRHRTVIPGKPYNPPPYGEKINLTDSKIISPDELRKTLISKPEQKISKALISIFNGLDPLLAEEIAFRAALDPQSTTEKIITEEINRLATVLQTISETIKSGNWHPEILTDKNKNFKDFTCLELKSYPDTLRIGYNKINEMLDDFFCTKIHQQKYKQLRQSLLQLVNDELKKVKQKRKGLAKKLKKAEKCEELQLWGELLTSQLYLAKKGQDKVNLINYYHPEQKQITVSLDPRLSPGENAQKFFKRYRKLKKSLPLAKKELKKSLQELNYLEGLKYNLESGSWEDIRDIKEELLREGYLKKSHKKQKKHEMKTKEVASKPLKFLSSDGYEIFVGKNNQQNDYLTLKAASKEDLWLHVKDIPGSHVVVKGENIPVETLKEAALLAAYYSKGSNSSNVPVDYTKIKHVKKPRQAKPGMVTYDQHKTLYVTADEKQIDKIARVNN